MATIKKTKRGGAKKGGAKRKKGGAKRGAKKRSSAKHVRPLRVGEVTTKKVPKSKLPPYTYCGTDGTDHKTGKKLHIVKRYKGKTLDNMKKAHANKEASHLLAKANKAAKKASKRKQGWEGIGLASAARDKVLSKAPEAVRNLALELEAKRQGRKGRAASPVAPMFAMG